MSITIDDIRNYAASRGVGTFLVRRTRQQAFLAASSHGWEARAFRSLEQGARIPCDLMARTHGGTAGEALWHCLLYILVDLPKLDVELTDTPQILFREGDDKIFISLDLDTDLPNMLRSRNFVQAPHKTDALFAEMAAAETEALAEACFGGKAA